MSGNHDAITTGVIIRLPDLAGRTEMSRRHSRSEPADLTRTFVRKDDGSWAFRASTSRDAPVVTTPGDALRTEAPQAGRESTYDFDNLFEIGDGEDFTAEFHNAFPNDDDKYQVLANLGWAMTD